MSSSGLARVAGVYWVSMVYVPSQRLRQVRSWWQRCLFWLLWLDLQHRNTVAASIHETDHFGSAGFHVLVGFFILTIHRKKESNKKKNHSSQYAVQNDWKCKRYEKTEHDIGSRLAVKLSIHWLAERNLLKKKMVWIINKLNYKLTVQQRKQIKRIKRAKTATGVKVWFGTRRIDPVTSKTSSCEAQCGSVISLPPKPGRSLLS